MIKAIQRFARCESGAVTVDWVVLTAGVIALMFLLVLTPVREAVRTLATDIGSQIELINAEIFGAADAGGQESSQG